MKYRSYFHKAVHISCPGAVLPRKQQLFIRLFTSTLTLRKFSSDPKEWNCPHFTARPYFTTWIHPAEGTAWWLAFQVAEESFMWGKWPQAFSQRSGQSSLELKDIQGWKGVLTPKCWAHTVSAIDLESDCIYQLHKMCKFCWRSPSSSRIPSCVGWSCALKGYSDTAGRRSDKKPTCGIFYISSGCTLTLFSIDTSDYHSLALLKSCLFWSLHGNNHNPMQSSEESIKQSYNFRLCPKLDGSNS